MGLQLLFFSFSLRSDWLSLFENDGSQTISRDLSEALLSAKATSSPGLGGWFRVALLLASTN